MIRGGGKRKGSAFERQVSGAFDRWWEVAPKTFWRTTNSGGWQEPGDNAPRLRPNSSPIWWPFVTECKHEKYIPVFELLGGRPKKRKKLLDYFYQVTQAQKQAIAAGRKPTECIRLVVFRENNSPIFAMFHPDDFLTVAQEQHSGGPGSILQPFAKTPVLHLPFPTIRVPAPIGEVDLVICTWDNFAQLFSKKAIYELFSADYIKPGVPFVYPEKKKYQSSKYKLKAKLVKKKAQSHGTQNSKDR